MRTLFDLLPVPTRRGRSSNDRSPYVEHCVESQDNVHDTLPCARVSINMKYL